MEVGREVATNECTEWRNDPAYESPVKCWNSTVTALSTIVVCVRRINMMQWWALLIILNLAMHLAASQNHRTSRCIFYLPITTIVICFLISNSISFWKQTCLTVQSCFAFVFLWNNVFFFRRYWEHCDMQDINTWFSNEKWLAYCYWIHSLRKFLSPNLHTITSLVLLPCMMLKNSFRTDRIWVIL